MCVWFCVAKQPYKYHFFECLCERKHHVANHDVKRQKPLLFPSTFMRVCVCIEWFGHEVIIAHRHTAHSTLANTLIIKIKWIIQVNCLCHTNTHTQWAAFVSVMLIVSMCVCWTYYVSCFNTKCFEPRGDECRVEISNDERERMKPKSQTESRAELSQA